MMRRAAGSRLALASVASARSPADGRYVASVVRAGAHLAELRWEQADGVDDETIVVAEIDGRRTWLEHRRNEPDADPSATAPHALLRLAAEDGTVLATADARQLGTAERWTLAVDGHQLRFDAPLRSRPSRYLLREEGRDSAWRVETCRRPRGWALDGPPDLSTASGLTCLWLVHLIDVARVLGRGRRWHAPPRWTVVLDDTGRLAPGGFGGFGTAGGGGSTPM